MTALAAALSAALLHFLWQGAAVAVVMALALAFLRNRAANVRYVAACAGFAVMAILPILTTALLFSSPEPTTAAQAAPVPSMIPASLPASAPVSPLGLAHSWALPIWGAGVLLFAIRLALSYLHVARLRRTGVTADPDILYRAADLAARMNISRRVKLLVSQLADSPSVTGWLRPAILIPAAVLAGIDAGQLEAIPALAQLNALLERLSRLRAFDAPEHPEVKEVEAQIRQLERSIDQMNEQTREQSKEESVAGGRDLEAEAREWRQNLRSKPVEPGPELLRRKISHIGVFSAPNLSVTQPPLRIGQVWNEESFEKLDSWAHTISPNPTYQFYINGGADLDLAIIFH